MSHPLELRMILSYLIIENFRGTFIFVLLGLFVRLLSFYLTRFACSLSSTTPDFIKIKLNVVT